MISTSPESRIRESLARDLRRIGLSSGDTVLVHSSLSSLGWVCGGSVAVVQALMDAVTPEGTLMMPTHTGDLSDPGPARTRRLVDHHSRDHARLRPTPTRGMGRIERGPFAPGRTFRAARTRGARSPRGAEKPRSSAKLATRLPTIKRKTRKLT